MQTVYSCNGLETTRIDTAHTGYFVAFVDKQVLGYDTSIKRMIAHFRDTFDIEKIVFRAASQRMLDAINDGADCLDVVCIENGPFGEVFDIR